MPTWISPRVRLGVTASVIIVIVCTLLLTADRSDNDSSPSPVATPDIEPTRATAAAPSSSDTPIPALPQAVITALGLRPTDSAANALAGMGAPATDLDALTQDVLAPMLDRDVSTDLADGGQETLSGLQDPSEVFGDLVFAEPPIHLDWTGCTECEPEGPPNLVPWGGIALSGPGGGEPQGASYLPESGNPSPVVVPEFEDLPPSGGDPPGGNPDPPDEEPRPKPPTVPVPEPSTATLVAAALSLVIGGTRARKGER